MLPVTYLNGNTFFKTANPLIDSVILLMFTTFPNAIPRLVFVGNDNMQCS